MAAKKAQTKPSGLYRSEDGGTTWARTNNENVRPFYYSQVRVDPNAPNRVFWSSTPVKVSDDGGKTARNATVGIHVDRHRYGAGGADRRCGGHRRECGHDDFAPRSDAESNERQPQRLGS